MGTPIKISILGLVIMTLSACTNSHQQAVRTESESGETINSATAQQTRSEDYMPHKQKPLTENGQRPKEQIIGHLAEEDLIAPVTSVADQPIPQRLDKLSARETKKRQAFTSWMVAPSAITPAIQQAVEPLDRENYVHFDDNALKSVLNAPTSTFSIDVDTASYSNVRRMLNQGKAPVSDAVRIEELINYFTYQYPVPESTKVPFSVYTEVGPSPWNSKTHLLHIGIQGYKLPKENLPPANLVFLLDVSGSMQASNKLGLLKQSMKLLVRQLRPQDTIAIAVYAGASGIVLPPTSGNHKATITRAIDHLTAGGSTNGAAGIRLAYQLAEQSFVDGGINRILLATDGDFNVGTVSVEALKDLVKSKRGSGVGLSTLGFGSGNYNDHLMEALPSLGNGTTSYIDSLREANKVLVEELGASLMTIAKDTKIQIEFNPAIVSEYRLIGYENRILSQADFNNDNVDAGDIGVGHSVTAIYEISLVGESAQRIDPLRYQTPESIDHKTNELAFLKLRYKQPDSKISQLVKHTILLNDVQATLNRTSTKYRFAASVAAFGQILRGGKFTENYTLNDVLKLAQTSRARDNFGYRSEFLGLVRLARSL